MTPVAAVFVRADSVERFSELFVYEPNTGQLRRRVVHFGKPAGAAVGTPNRRGHMVVSVDRKLLYVHRIAWALQTGRWPAHEVDHIDGNPGNNCWSNLRDVTHAVNVQNRRRPNESHVGRRLLGAFRERGKFTSKVVVNGRVHRLGTFDTEQDAHLAYVEAKRLLHEGCTL